MKLFRGCVLSLAVALVAVTGPTGAAQAGPPAARPTTAAIATGAAAKPDLIRPKVSIKAPGSSKVKAWRHLSGRATDRGGSQLRYVVVSAFQLRKGEWFGLVGNGSQTRWKKFRNRLYARYGSTERTAVLTDPDRWSIDLPRVRSGRLVVIAKAADFAANERSRQVIRMIG